MVRDSGQACVFVGLDDRVCVLFVALCHAQLLFHACPRVSVCHVCLIVLNNLTSKCGVRVCVFHLRARLVGAPNMPHATACVCVCVPRAPALSCPLCDVLQGAKMLDRTRRGNMAGTRARSDLRGSPLWRL